MALHVIVGAGPIGSTTARQLADAGHRVRLVTRSGSGPAHPSIERVAADATDAARLTVLARGAAALYNCANPRYHRWPVDWPPLATALLTTAEQSGAVLVTMSNLYGYGPVDRPMTEDLPLAASTVKGQVRARMWRQALTAHEAGRVRVTEARASDYVGPSAQSLFSDLVLPAVRRGRPATVPANVDVAHSLTYTVDAATTLVALATHELAWGQPWHVPTAEPVSLREAATRYAALVGAPTPKIRRMPGVMLRAGGLFSPVAREFVEMRYQFERPFVLDSAAAQRAFDLVPTSLDEALRSLIPAAGYSSSPPKSTRE